jgi:hypothetical protein
MEYFSEDLLPEFFNNIRAELPLAQRSMFGWSCPKADLANIWAWAREHGLAIKMLIRLLPYGPF